MRQQRGFTLVEIMASMAVISILVFLTFLLLDKKDVALHKVEIRQLALQIAQSEMEYIRTSRVLSSRQNFVGKNQQMLKHLKQGRGQVKVEPFEVGLKKVSVVVSWKNQFDRLQSIALTTLVKS